MLPVIFFIITLYCIERKIKHLSLHPPPFSSSLPLGHWVLPSHGAGERRLWGWAGRAGTGTPCTPGNPFPTSGAGKPLPGRLRCRLAPPAPGGQRRVPAPGARSRRSPAGRGESRYRVCVCVVPGAARLPPPRPPPPAPPPAPAAATPGGAARRGSTGRAAGPAGSCEPQCLRSHPFPPLPPLVWGRVGAGSRLPGAGGDDFPVGICQVRVCAARRAPRLAPRVIYYLSPRRQRCGSGAAASNPRRRRGTRRGVPEQRRAGRERCWAGRSPAVPSSLSVLGAGAPLSPRLVAPGGFAAGRGRGSREKAFLRAGRRLVVKKQSGAELEEKESNVFLIVI